MQQELTASAGVGAAALRVAFQWRADRFAHIISLIRSDGGIVSLLESVEGSAADHWPPSPPLQSLSIETLPEGRRAALLVGMAGQNHWSASIEVVPGEAALIFDIACRTKDRDAALGSRYRLASPNETSLFAAADRSWIEAQSGEDSVVFVPLQAATEGARLESLDSLSFAIMPQVSPSGPTIRWRYRVEILATDS